MENIEGFEHWTEERTTFERVYDTIVGLRSFQSAEELADFAHCSSTAARKAAEKLTEMGIAQRRGDRPARYRRNDSYFEWKRIEMLSREHSTEELEERLSELVKENEGYQQDFGVPNPEAATVSDVDIDDHDAFHHRLEAMNEWRTIRRDIGILRRAIERSNRTIGDGALA